MQFNTRYREPVRLPQVVAVRGRVVKVEGRKMYVWGTIEKGNGELIIPSPNHDSVSEGVMSGADCLSRTGDLFAEADGVWIKANKDVGRSQL